MFQLYDSSQPGGEWLKEAVPQFLQRTELVPNGNEGLNPTDYFILAPKLFDLKPYDVANELELRACQLCQLPFAGYVRSFFRTNLFFPCMQALDMNLS